MATKEEAGGAGVGAAVSDEEHAGFVAAPPLPVPTDAAGAASVAEVASGVVPVAHGSGDVDVDVGVPKLSVTSASGVEVEVPIDGGRSRSSTTTASSSSTTPPLGTTTKQPKKKPSGIAMAPVTEPVMKDTIDSPVFEMGSPKPPPSLKAFVHAIEAGQVKRPNIASLFLLYSVSNLMCILIRRSAAHRQSGNANTPPSSTSAATKTSTASAQRHPFLLLLHSLLLLRALLLFQHSRESGAMKRKRIGLQLRRRWGPGWVRQRES